MRVAIAMILKSLEPGRYHNDYQQFETIRKLRAGFSNIFMASYEGVTSLRTVGGDKAKHHLTSSPTQSMWFERFSQGCLRRMGQDVRQDWAIPLPVVTALMEACDVDWASASSLAEKNLIAMVATYAVIAFCGSFRGNEVFLTDLHGLRKYQSELKDKDYVIVPLLGRFKGEQHPRYHLTPLAATTNSGLKVREWIHRLVKVKEDMGKFNGPAFQDDVGGILSPRVIEGGLRERLHIIKETRPGLIPVDVDCFENFGISRSFRRGATSTARVRGVSDKHVDLINRWRKFENARGRRPTLAMHDHYSDIEILIPELVKFSQAL